MTAARDPRQRFRRVAPRRTQRVLDALALLGRCGNRATYRYEPAEAQRIFAAIEAEIAATRAQFERERRRAFQL